MSMIVMQIEAKENMHDDDTLFLYSARDERILKEYYDLLKEQKELQDVAIEKEAHESYLLQKAILQWKNDESYLKSDNDLTFDLDIDLESVDGDLTFGLDSE